jgi:hypothetical protein
MTIIRRRWWPIVTLEARLAAAAAFQEYGMFRPTFRQTAALETLLFNAMNVSHCGRISRSAPRQSACAPHEHHVQHPDDGLGTLAR